MTSLPDHEAADGCTVEIPAEARAGAVPVKAGSGVAPKVAGPVRLSRWAARNPPKKSEDESLHGPGGGSEPVDLPAVEPLRPTLGRARSEVPVGVVHMQNLGDSQGCRTSFVMALHITRIKTHTGDLYGISATKEWGATINGRWLAVGDVKSADITSHAKTWWKLGNPANNRDLCWDIVAYDHYFSIRSASPAISQGGWLYAALPEVDHGHRRVLTWTLQGHPTDDVDMRWSLSRETGKPKAKAKGTGSISIADVNRWKGVSDPKSSANALEDVYGETVGM